MARSTKLRLTLAAVIVCVLAGGLALSYRVYASDNPKAPPPQVEITAGGEAVVVPAPPAATLDQTQQVGEAAAKTLKDVAKGSVPIEVATRDLSKTRDSGQNETFWAITLLFGFFVRPTIDWYIHRTPWVPDSGTGRIMLAASVLTFMVAFFLLHKGDPSLPQSWKTWLWAGFGAAGFGSLTALPKPKEGA